MDRRVLRQPRPCGRPGVGAAERTPAYPLSGYVADVVVWGTPDEVVDQLQELRETISLDYVMAAPLSHATFELFTEKVMPKLLYERADGPVAMGHRRPVAARALRPGAGAPHFW